MEIKNIGDEVTAYITDLNGVCWHIEGKVVLVRKIRGGGHDYLVKMNYPTRDYPDCVLVKSSEIL